MGSFEIGTGPAYRFVLPGTMKCPGIPVQMRVRIPGEPEKVNVLPPLGIISRIERGICRGNPDGSYGGGQAGIQGEAQSLGLPDPGELGGYDLTAGVHALVRSACSYHGNFPGGDLFQSLFDFFLNSPGMMLPLPS
mgnify:CR=1 FL=1